MAGAFTFGMEEEYFLVDAETKVVARDVPAAFFDEAEKASDGRISTEFLQPQVEVVSSPHVNMADARAELRMLRRTVSTVAADMALPFWPPAPTRRRSGARRSRPTSSATTR